MQYLYTFYHSFIAQKGFEKPYHELVKAYLLYVAFALRIAAYKGM